MTAYGVASDRVLEGWDLLHPEVLLARGDRVVVLGPLRAPDAMGW